MTAPFSQGFRFFPELSAGDRTDGGARRRGDVCALEPPTKNGGCNARGCGCCVRQGNQGPRSGLRLHNIHTHVPRACQPMGCRRQRASVRIDERRGAGCEFRRQGANRAARKLPQRPQGAPEPLRSPRLAAAHAKALRALASQRHSTPTQTSAAHTTAWAPALFSPPTLPTRPHRSSSSSSHIHVESKAAQTRASWLTGGLSQRQSTPQATPSFGQSRPISRLGARPIGRAVGIAHRRRQGRGLFPGEISPPTTCDSPGLHRLQGRLRAAPPVRGPARLLRARAPLRTGHG